jgi:general secretion pathway protein K
MANTHRHRPSFRSTRRQRGAALLTAMIIVTLVATLASAMVWQQWRAVQIESAERARMQAAWILSGALDFAKLILKEDLRSGRPTALTEPWATPLAEARLSTFLAVDKSETDDGPEAFLSGSISDAQARYNLRNLLRASTGVVDPVEVEALGRLCGFVGVETGVAQRIARSLQDALVKSSDGTSTSGAPLEPKTVDQLTWLGIDPASIQALRPYIILLPEPTTVNANTASQQVLAAVVKGLDLATAERVVQTRQRTPFKTPDEFYKAAGVDPSQATTATTSTTTGTTSTTGATATAKRVDVRSSYFEVHGKLRMVDRVLLERSVVHRMPNGVVNVLERERVASLDQVGT